MKKHQLVNHSFFVLVSILVLNFYSQGSEDEFNELSLAKLLNLEIKTAFGLTAADEAKIPVPMTTLDSRDIEQSGARDLNHLLEYYVPNAQVIDHHHLQSHIGFRGIISDREDKYLYQVNGRTMNNRLLVGADNERAIPLMGDIREIHVVRGPASTTHGAGAMAGVIDVETHNGLTFQGLDFKVRPSVVDEYIAAEMRYGKKFGKTSGLFLYYGFAHQPGMDADYYIGKSYPAQNGLPENVAGEPSKAPLAKFGAAAYGEPRHKLHLSYNIGSFKAWFRFVQDGNQDRPTREIYKNTKPDDMPVKDWTRGRQMLHRQFTLTGAYDKELSDAWKFNVLGSYDIWWMKDRFMGHVTIAPDARDAVESEVFGRALATWSPNKSHSIGFGVENSFEWFYNPFFSFAQDGRDPKVTDREWEVNTYSFLAEYQWAIISPLTLFLSARTDKHTFSDWLFSPRSSLVFLPTDKDNIKLMGGMSVRRGCDEELWSEHKRKSTIPDPESLLMFEISYDRKLTDSWSTGISGIYSVYNTIGWIPAELISTAIGRYDMAGGEFRMSYVNESTRIIFSHGHTKLVDADIPSSLPNAGQAITAEPYGYGNDLAEWAPGITKLALMHDIIDQLTVSSSFVYYSGFPGAEDFADYARTLDPLPSAMPLSDADYDEPYGPNVYLNIGLEYRPIEKLALRADAYNLVALVDEKLSKRNNYFRLSEFNTQPASAAVSLAYMF